ncbi:hypothetical protein ACF0H5_006880 [Mactra antiquata]
MSWGSSWGTNGLSSSGNSGGKWGSSSWGNNGNNKDPEGQHNPSCISGNSGWGSKGPMSGYYDESCSGCRHERSATTWGTTPSGGNTVATLAKLVGGAYIARKSLWD